MALVANRRPVMTLFSGASDPFSHRARIVLAEKNIAVEVIDVAADALPDNLLDVNPYGTVPTLVDRELALYNSLIIMEYLDERYPHPSLMPVDPVNRARTRLFLHRVEADWYSTLDKLASRSGRELDLARKHMVESLTTVAPIFQQKPYFMSDEFSMVDCSVAPVLWRLDAYDVKLSAQAKPLQKYADRLFNRESFRASLTAPERELRHDYL